jgi:hypothetical protein
MMGRHRRLPQVCREKGHRWKHAGWGSVCYEECARRNCDATRRVEEDAA